MMEIEEMHRIARERFRGICRVCPVCNGRACAGEMPGIGGVGTGSSFMANFDSLYRIKLNLRTIHDAPSPDISYSFFGKPLTMPILVAPIFPSPGQREMAFIDLKFFMPSGGRKVER